MRLFTFRKKLLIFAFQKTSILKMSRIIANAKTVAYLKKKFGFVVNGACFVSYDPKGKTITFKTTDGHVKVEQIRANFEELNLAPINPHTDKNGVKHFMVFSTNLLKQIPSMDENKAMANYLHCEVDEIDEVLLTTYLDGIDRVSDEGKVAFDRIANDCKILDDEIKIIDGGADEESVQYLKIVQCLISADPNTELNENLDKFGQDLYQPIDDNLGIDLGDIGADFNRLKVVSGIAYMMVNQEIRLSDESEVLLNSMFDRYSDSDVYINLSATIPASNTDVSRDLLADFYLEFFIKSKAAQNSDSIQSDNVLVDENSISDNVPTAENIESEDTSELEINNEVIESDNVHEDGSGTNVTELNVTKKEEDDIELFDIVADIDKKEVSKVTKPKAEAKPKADASAKKSTNSGKKGAKK